MTKAILVIDIPDDLKYEYLYINGEIRYTSVLENGYRFLDEIVRKKLKPMPEKKPISQDRGKNNCEYSLLDRLEYQKGFNDCIDEILGEEDDDR